MLPFLINTYALIEVFRNSEVGIIVLLKYENELELVTSDIGFNSINPWQIQIFIEIHLVGNYFQIISIWSYTKMSIMPTSGVSKKLEWQHPIPLS